MTARRPRNRTAKRETRLAPQPRRRLSAEEAERRRAQVLRVFTQTAVASAVLGGIFLLTSNKALHSMALFLFAWAAGWASASAYLLVRRLVTHDRRSGKS